MNLTRNSLTRNRSLSSFSVIIVLAFLFLGAQSASASPINLGGVADYVVFGVGGTVQLKSLSEFEVYQSDTVINGNVGMGPYDELTHNIDATINGRFDYDLTDANPGAQTGTITGGIHQLDLSGVAADARAASADAASRAFTQSYATLSENQVIAGNGGLNVIRVTGDVTLKKGLTLQGGASDQFIFQFTTTGTGHVLTLSGMTMTLTGGVLADNIVWNLNGLGGDVVISSGAVVYGNFLAPDRQLVSDHGIVAEGRLIAGGSGTLLSVHSASQVNTPAGTPVPEPSSILLLTLGLASMTPFAWRKAARVRS